MITLLLGLLSLVLLELHGAQNQVIILNPHEIISMRPPTKDEHFAPGTRCIINTSDGKFTLVKEDCSTVEALLEGMK
jgi:hypothetical protein